ncbi:hypothetical protein DQ354_19130 [Arthrobacter sp. AQ5-06]|nr:hypothetical protein DQ354_19130 [Arthrobacter sp. AQ5-06]
MIAIAWQGVRGFPVRTALTTLGLMVGIVGLVSVFSASETIVATVKQRAILTGGQASTFDISGLRGQGGLERSGVLLAQLGSSFSSSVRGTRLASTSATKLELGSKPFDADLIFTEPYLRELRSFPIVAGQWIDNDQSGMALVLNEAAFEASQVTENEQLRVSVERNAQKIPVTVTGVVNDGSPRPSAYANINHLPSLMVNQENLISTSLELSSPELTSNVITTRLSELDNLSGTTTSWNVNRRDTVEQLSSEVFATRSSFLIVGILGLLSTALAVANVGLSALRERSAELSLRRALGGRRWQIPGLMILESQIIAVLAGAIAVPVSYLIYPVVAAQFGAPFGVGSPPYPWMSAFIGLGLGMTTALLGSAAPAIRALNTPISSMMRE